MVINKHSSITYLTKNKYYNNEYPITSIPTKDIGIILL